MPVTTNEQLRGQAEVVADEPTKAEIMDDIRVGLKQAAAGEGRPAHEAYAELQRRLDSGVSEKTRQLIAALDKMREGLTQAQLDEMTAAMTEKYIKPWDESMWIE